MSDIEGTLLAQYYGFSKNPKTKKFLSIHECMSNAENDVHKLTSEHSTADTNDDDTFKETEIQVNNVENEENNSEIDIPVRSSRVLEWEAFEDDEKTSEFDIRDIMVNLYENTNAFSSKNAKDLALNTTKTISTILGPEDNEENLYLSLSEDALPDSASDISSVAGKKKLFKSSNSFASPLTSLQDKNPIYNETFIDLASTGLTLLPIEIIKKYITIRMLYLENNSLTELPKELFISLPQLQWLDVRNNQLTNLPTSVQSHPSLETILLEGNKIEKLPLELCLIPKLKILNVAHNPIIIPPEDIIALGCSSILHYLRAEWNKLHPDEFVKFVEQRIEPKLSTILCYQSPREKRLKLPKIPRRTSKTANNIDDSSKGTWIRKRSRAYKPSNRYSNTQIDTFPENSATNTDDTYNNEMSFLYVSCARNIAATQCKDENNKEKSDDIVEDIRDKRNDGQHAFLKMITSCHNMKKIFIKNEIAEVNAKILHLIGSSPRSCYIRQNITGLITYRHYREKECKIKTISNETKYIALTKPDNSTVFNKDKKKYRNTEHAELVFDIVTKDMQRMRLRPTQLKDSCCILSCLENYFGI